MAKVGRPLQGDKRKITINISLDEETRDLLKKLAAEHHTTVSGLVVKLALAEEDARNRGMEGDAKDE